MHRRCVAVLLVIAFCSRPAPAQSVKPVNTGDCASARERARTIQGVLEPSTGTAPQVLALAREKKSAPVQERDTYLRYSVRVDTNGLPISRTDSLRGLGESNYAREVKATMRRNRYAPAMIDGCSVEGTVVVFLYTTVNGALDPWMPDSVPASCADIRQRAKTMTFQKPDTIYPPVPRKIFLPPLPAPANMRGRKITLSIRVDEDGWAIRDLSRIAGATDNGYANKLRENLMQMSFVPARSKTGCIIEATTMIEMRVGP